MKRHVEKDFVAWKNEPGRKPLIVLGARQVGKTYSLHRFGQKYFTNYHYLNAEEDSRIAKIFETDLKPDRIIQDIELYLNTTIDLENDLLIIDEVQETPRALTSLKFFHITYPQLAICTAGSLLGVELSSAPFPVGYVEFLHLYPMSFNEFLQADGDDRSLNVLYELNNSLTISEMVHHHLWEQLKIYFIVGGLPEVVQSYIDAKSNRNQALKIAREKQRQLINAYFADIAKHAGKENAMHIERIWNNIPEQLAKAQNGSSQKFQFKGVIPGQSRYSRMAGGIDWLEKAGLVIKVAMINNAQLPLSAFAKYNQFKLYIFDVGILGALSRLSEKIILDYDYGSYKGYFAENFVTQEFRCKESQPLYYWQEGRSEVEFVREIDGQAIPIEIKSGWVNKAKSIQIFANKYVPPYRVIMSARNLTIDKGRKIHRYPLYTAGLFPLIPC